MSTTAPTALIIGANGALGRVVSDVFTQRGWHITRAMRSAAGQPGDVVSIDLTDREALAALMNRVDVTVNTVPAGFGAESVALERGHRLLSLAITPMPDQTTLRNTYRHAPGTAILNAGLAPGVSNLVVADLVRHDPAGTGKISIAVPLPWNNYHGAEGVRLVHRYMTKSGRHGSYSGVHDSLLIKFPDPIGVKNCVGWAERDAGWVQRLAGGRLVRAYCYLDSPLLNSLIHTMNKMGSLHRLPLSPFLRMTERMDAPTVEPVSIAVSLQQGETLHSRIIECNGWYLSAAQAGEVMAREFVSDNTLVARGCIDSDEAFTLRRIAPLLAERNHLTIVPQDDQPVSTVQMPNSREHRRGTLRSLPISMAMPR